MRTHERCAAIGLGIILFIVLDGAVASTLREELLPFWLVGALACVALPLMFVGLIGYTLYPAERERP